MIRCLLGPDAVAEHKLHHGNPLTILGITLTINAAGIVCFPDEEKIAKWVSQIEQALKAGALYGGEASKLAGKCG